MKACGVFAQNACWTQREQGQPTQTSDADALGIAQSLAWEAGSSLYPLLVTAAGGTPPPPEDTPQRKQEPRTPDPVGHPLTPEADPGARPRGSALGSAHAAGERSAILSRFRHRALQARSV